MTNTGATITRLDKGSKTAGAVMLVLGGVLAAVGLMSNGGDPNALAHSYLFGWVFWACLALGCCGLSLLHHAARGSWGFPIVRLLEAGGGPVTLAVFGVAILPVLTVWKEVFYPWARPDEVARDPVLLHRASTLHYFDSWFVLLRWAIFFGAFILMTSYNKKLLRMEEQTGEEKWWVKRQFVGGIFLVLYVLCVNFLWTDVLMSQYPHWFSTIYGVWFVVGSCLISYCTVALILGLNYTKAPYNRAAEPWLLKDIGNWMLAYTMIWGYFSLSQYLIIWSGNLPEFTEYFIKRSVNNWGLLGTGLILIHFFIPFLALLVPEVKTDPKKLRVVAVWLLVAHFLDIWYQVLPKWRAGLSIGVGDIGMFLVFGGVWWLLFGWQVQTGRLITYRTPRLQEATDHA